MPTLETYTRVLQKKRDEETFFDKVYWFFPRMGVRVGNIFLEVKWGFQRMFRGYDDRAYWNLNYYITDIAIPALESLRDHGYSYPVCFKNVSEWHAELQKMIEAFKLFQEDDLQVIMENNEIIQEGLKSFGKHFMSLWD